MPDDEHPVLALGKEAEQITRALGEFFDPVEKYFGPHDPEEWPRDLTREELGTLLPRLNNSIANLAWAVGLMVDENPPGPGQEEKVRQVREGIQQIGSGFDAIMAAQDLFSAPGAPPAGTAESPGPATSPPPAIAPGQADGQQRGAQRVAAENFPSGPAADPGAAAGITGPPEAGPASGPRRLHGQSTRGTGGPPMGCR